MGFFEESDVIWADEDIVRRVLTGEKHLYEKLMRKYNPLLYRVSMSVVNDPTEAEDIMQAAYLNAFLQLSKFRFTSGFGTWLTRIVINESLLARKKKSRHLHALTEGHSLNDDNETPLKSLMNNELRILLERAIATLPDKYKLVFVLREMEEMSTAEVMETLDLTESNVKIRLKRAKEMLREHLSSYYKSSQVFEFHLVRCDIIVRNVMYQINGLN